MNHIHSFCPDGYCITVNSHIDSTTECQTIIKQGKKKGNINGIAVIFVDNLFSYYAK